jgi:environmental stress-induced protein Ves
VDEAGPFSAFPGVERILVVTEGAGLVLSHGKHAPRARLRRLEPYRFAGDWPTIAELPGGPITDFNVMLRAGRARADVQGLALGLRRSRDSLAAGHAFVHLLVGRCRARVTGEEEPFDLGAGSSLWVRGLRGGEELDLEGRASGCELLVVALGQPG